MFAPAHNPAAPRLWKARLSTPGACTLARLGCLASCQLPSAWHGSLCARSILCQELLNVVDQVMRRLLGTKAPPHPAIAAHQELHAAGRERGVGAWR